MQVLTVTHCGCKILVSGTASQYNFGVQGDGNSFKEELVGLGDKAQYKMLENRVKRSLNSHKREGILVEIPFGY